MEYFRAGMNVSGQAIRKVVLNTPKGVEEDSRGVNERSE